MKKKGVLNKESGRKWIQDLDNIQDVRIPMPVGFGLTLDLGREEEGRAERPVGQERWIKFLLR